jgi:hypothetical protein
MMVTKILRAVFQYSTYLAVLFGLSTLAGLLVMGAAHFLLPVSWRQVTLFVFFPVVGLSVLYAAVNWKSYTDSFDIDLLRARKRERDRKQS